MRNRLSRVRMSFTAAGSWSAVGGRFSLKSVLHPGSPPVGALWSQKVLAGRVVMVGKDAHPAYPFSVERMSTLVLGRKKKKAIYIHLPHMDVT